MENMAVKRQHSILTLFLIIILGLNLVNIQAVSAQGEPPTEPAAPTEVVTEPAVQDTAIPIDATATPQLADGAVSQESATNGTADSAIVSSQELENTDIVVL